MKLVSPAYWAVRLWAPPLSDDKVQYADGTKATTDQEASDVTEFLADIDLRAVPVPQAPRIAYHAACSLQHGQRVLEQPKRLLRQAGFTVLVPSFTVLLPPV